MPRPKKSELYKSERLNFYNEVVDFSQKLLGFVRNHKDKFNAKHRRILVNYKNKTDQILAILGTGSTFKEYNISVLTNEELKSYNSLKKLSKIDSNIHLYKLQTILDSLFLIVNDNKTKKWKKIAAEREIKYIIKTKSLKRKMQIKKLIKSPWL